MTIIKFNEFMNGTYKMKEVQPSLSKGTIEALLVLAVIAAFVFSIQPLLPSLPLAIEAF
jgi:hypothetical protein